MIEFRSRWGKYTTDLIIDGKRKHIVFETFRYGGSYYATSDRKIAEALKNDSDFNKDFYVFRDEMPKKTKSKDKADNTKKDSNNNKLDDTGSEGTEDDTDNTEDKGEGNDDTPDDVEGEKEEVVNGPTIVEEVTNITQAREYLKSIGVPYQRLNSATNIINNASEQNVQFPNLK